MPLPDTPYILSTDAWAFITSSNYADMRSKLLNSGTLTSDAPVTISQTWNGTGSTVFKALVVNATTPGTTSSGDSLVADFQVGGVSQLRVHKSGGIGLNNLMAIGGISGPWFMVYNGGTPSGYAFGVNTAGRLSLPNTGTLEWASFASGTPNTVLLRDGADNTLALRNGAAAQTFNVYGTYTSAASYARLAIACDTSGNATLTTQSTGVAGTVSINGVPVGLGKGNDLMSVAAGTGALSNNTTGLVNSAFGQNALLNNTTGAYNVAFGRAALSANIAGSKNVGVGVQSLFYSANISTTSNIGIGFNAGSLTSTGDANNPFIGNIYIGDTTKSLSTNLSNEIVIGHFAVGIGSNSVVLGNDSITKTALKGNVGIGTTAPTANLVVTNSLGSGYTGTKVNIYGSVQAGGTFVDSIGNTIMSSTLSVGGNGGGLDPTFNVYTGANNSRFLVTAGGNVGIGTTAPSEKLHVLGGKILVGDPTDITGTSVNGELTVQAWRAPQLNIVCNQGSSNFIGLNIKVATTTIAGLLVNSASGEVKIGGLSSGGYFPTFYSNNAEIMRFSIGGNVGIGTTSPTSKLHVSGTIKPEQATITTNATTAFTLDITHAGTVLTTSNAGNVTITLPAAGTVGVGYNVMIIQGGAGTITVAQGAGNTLNSFGSLYSSAGLHAAICIVCTAANTYNISGNLA